jgi:hypothetical protein
MAVLAAGCFWRHFDARVAVNAELLRDEARKGVDLAVAGRVSAEELAELLYPLARARALAADARRRLGSRPAPPALRGLEKLLAAYAKLCNAIDRERRAHAGPVPRPVLARPLGRVARSAARLLGRRAAGVR